MQAEDYTTHTAEVDGWSLLVESYRVGDKFYCTVSSADPGARFARSDGATKDEAERIALEKARRYLAQTRIRKT
jgi:hypothetical protein